MQHLGDGLLRQVGCIGRQGSQTEGGCCQARHAQPKAPHQPAAVRLGPDVNGGDERVVLHGKKDKHFASADWEVGLSSDR